MTDSSIVMMCVAGCASIAIAVKSTADAVARVVASRHQRAIEGELPNDSRLARLEVAVESIAVEIERISEGQRFTTRLLNSQMGGPVPRLERADKFDTPH